jgi:hypothetical protein
MAIGLAVIVAPITVLETAASPHPSIWSNTAFLICLGVGVLALAAGAWILAAFFLPLPLPKTRHEREAFKGSAEQTTLGRTRSVPPPPVSVPEEQAVVATQAPQPVFDEAPPELADLSPASLKELLAGRTDAQVITLMEQHVGKSVRVSGEVEGVEFGTVPWVRLKGAVTLQLFFDADGYDPEPILLALNMGDEIVVSGQIWKIREFLISLDKCRLVEARGRRS